MKPVVSAMHAWSWYVSPPSPQLKRSLTNAGLLVCSTVISVFAIIILSILAGLYRSGHEEFVGGIEDPSPEEGKAVAGTIFTAVIVYAVCHRLRDSESSISNS